MKTEDKQPMDRSKVIAICVAILFALLFLKVYSYVVAYLKSPDNTNGAVGALSDAFNGLLSPFIAVISSFLIFFSFSLLPPKVQLAFYKKMFRKFRIKFFQPAGTYKLP